METALQSLQPGDELVLNGGTYTLSSGFRVTVVGTAAQPIVMRNKEGHAVTIHQTNTNQNIFEIDQSQYFVIRGIEFKGGSRGIRIMPGSNFITIESCEIHGTAGNALSANGGGTYEGLHILKNHIHHTGGHGEGMYLGCNNNTCRVKNSIVELNYIHHLNGPTISQGDGIELKEGSSGNIVRDNVIHDTNYPGIISYSTVGNGPANIIERNIIWNTNDNAIQSAEDAIIRNNIVLGKPIAVQAHQAGAPANISVTHNTILSSGSGINLRNAKGSVIIANNAVYAQSGSAIRLISGDFTQVVVAGNVGQGGLSGAASGYSEGNGLADFVSANFSGAPPLNLFPATGGALIDAGASQYQAVDDFNSSDRNGTPEAGAYLFQSSGNPGWVLTAGFKVLVIPNVAPAAPRDLRIH